MAKTVFARRFTVLLLACLATAPVFAQGIPGLPRQSQKQVITQTIGITDITVTYHRPQVRSRAIWDRLVPYDEVWRAGANQNTTISFSDPVKIEGQDLAAGTYGLHMLPGENAWQVIFSSNSTSWGSFSYSEDEDTLRVTVRPQKAPYQENLAYRFNHLTADGGIIALHWEELEVPFEFEIDIHPIVLAKIRRDLRSLPGYNWSGWNAAADYCRQNNINHEEALEWVERALSMEENYTALSTKAGLLDQIGREDEGLAIRIDSVEHADEGQANGLGYQLLQRRRHDDAIAVFERNAKKHPNSWNAWDSLGEGLATAGRTKEAITNYTKAHEMAPDDQKERIAEVLAGLKNR